MIGCFPDPYPEELLYSVCARYSERVKYPNKNGILSELFGRKDTIAVVDLPNGLNHLISQLPPGHRYTTGD